MEDCYFCELADNSDKSGDVFYEDKKVIAMLDIDWAVKGHSLVIWKEHALNISDLSEEDFKHFSTILRRVEAKLLKVLNAEKSIILKSGGLESHFHFHLYPVSSNTTWTTVKELFDKKTKYSPTAEERRLLLTNLVGL